MDAVVKQMWEKNRLVLRRTANTAAISTFKTDHFRFTISPKENNGAKEKIIRKRIFKMALDGHLEFDITSVLN